MILIPLLAIGLLSTNRPPNPTDEPRAVIRRLIGRRADGIRLQLTPDPHTTDRFTYESHAGHLSIQATSKVAICSGFYQYLKSKGLGMRTWAGTRLAIPAKWPDAPKTTATSPFKFRQYFNVVTYGYSMPFWSWERWEQELDWMALHGVNMPIDLLGTEAIGTRVWRSLHLTQAEIDPFYTGPAYLPWQRMGNLTKHDGPLSDSWNADQVALEHKVLNRIHALDMTPIVPGFSGFVPPAVARLKPGTELSTFEWGGFSDDKKSHFLSPDSPLFAEISHRFVSEWEKEFGKAKYRLVDSFNEMELPAAGAARETFLANYGNRVHTLLEESSPGSVWVLQGWMFGYQREIWNPKTVSALLSKVPNDRALVLDMACDYNKNFWNNGMNWKLFNSYGGKGWVYGVIPNMGGKTGYTGVMDFYAKDVFFAVNSPEKGNLQGYGYSPEGIENNEVLAELYTDNIWRKEPVQLDQWIEQYCRARYGAAPKAALDGWKLLRESCYGTFTDHPKFGWQARRASQGTMNKDPKFEQGVRKLLSCSDQLKGSSLYVADSIEQTAMILGSRAEDLFTEAKIAHDKQDFPFRDKQWAKARALLLTADRLLESHPNHRLSRWIDFARGHGKSPNEKDRYERDARRIVTVWGPPVNDYSCRLWSGLIRDFYVPRMDRVLKGLQGEKPNIAEWEAHWFSTPGISNCKPFDDPVTEARKALDDLP